MDAHDADRALETVLVDLEAVTVADVAANPHNAICKLIVAIALIGRRFVPARTSASDETMPGRGDRARRMAERRRDAGVAYAGPLPVGGMTGAGYRLDPPLGGLPGLRQDPPRPAVRDRIAGVTFADLERALADKDRDELAETLTRLEAAQRTSTELQNMVADRDRTIAAALADRAHARSEVDRLEQEGNERARSEANALNAHASLRSSLQSALGLPANALDSVIVAKVREMGDVLKAAHEQIEEARGRLRATLGNEPRLADANLPLLVARAEQRIAVLTEEHQRERTAVDGLRAEVAERTRQRDAALSACDRANALIDAVETWAGRYGPVIGGGVPEANKVLLALDAWRGSSSKTREFVPRAELMAAQKRADETEATCETVIADLRKEVAARTEDLRVADADRIPLRMDLASARAAANLMHARWQRIQPLIKALHAWTRPASDNPFPYESSLVAAFEAWQKSEADALDAEEAKPHPALRALFGAPPVDDVPDPVGALADVPDEVVDVPRQPDDPGVEPDCAVRVLDERGAIVAYLRRYAECYAPGIASDVVRNLADGIERGAHAGSERPADGATPPAPRTCHPGDRCAGYPECESCGPARM